MDKLIAETAELSKKTQVNMKPELSGKCVLKISTGKSNLTFEIPKLNFKTGENNADNLINEVLHFAIMRHGKDLAKKMFDEKLAKYEVPHG